MQWSWGVEWSVGVRVWVCSVRGVLFVLEGRERREGICLPRDWRNGMCGSGYKETRREEKKDEADDEQEIPIHREITLRWVKELSCCLVWITKKHGHLHSAYRLVTQKMKMMSTKKKKKMLH